MRREAMNLFLFFFLSLRVCSMNEIENRAPIGCCLLAEWVHGVRQANEYMNLLFELICKYWAFSHLLVSHTAIMNSTKYQWQIDEFSSNLYLLMCVNDDW